MDTSIFILDDSPVGSIIFPFACSTRWRSLLIPMFTRSQRDLKPSFVLPFTSINKQIVLSYTFFFMCIASTACGTSKSFHHGKYLKNIDIFLKGTPSTGVLVILIFLP